ncbi:MAG: IMPACT family protein [Paludibacteraceae bacterium]
MADTYLTIAHTSEGYYKEKGSRFLAFAHPVRTVQEVKTLVESARKTYHDARHVCYAYMLGGERTEFRANDDGEPTGTAGKPILGQINAHQLSDVLIIVVRYFGGILLGTGGLVQAYKTAAADALNNNTIVERTVEVLHTIRYDYAQLNVVMRIVKEYGLTIVEQQQGLECTLRFSVRQSFAPMVINLLTQNMNIKLIDNV